MNKIIEAFNKYHIEFHLSDFDELKPDLIKEIEAGIEEVEDCIQNKDGDNCDLLALLGFHCSTYNGQVYNELMQVITEIYHGQFNSTISFNQKLSPSHVELIQYTLCGRNLADYGTSPRGCWLTPIAKSLFELMQVYDQIIQCQKIEN